MYNVKYPGGFIAGADLSAKQYHFVRMSAQNACNQASEAAHSAILGILDNKPRSGEHAAVTLLGETRVVVGGAITAGDVLTTNGSGRAAVVTSGQMAVARALDTAGADGQTIRCVAFPPIKWFGAP